MNFTIYNSKISRLAPPYAATLAGQMGKPTMTAPVNMASHSRVNKVRFKSPSFIETGSRVKRIAGSGCEVNIYENDAFLL